VDGQAFHFGTLAGDHARIGASGHAQPRPTPVELRIKVPGSRRNDALNFGDARAGDDNRDDGPARKKPQRATDVASAEEVSCTSLATRATLVALLGFAVTAEAMANAW
jgi:hypothetical protein